MATRPNAARREIISNISRSCLFLKSGRRCNKQMRAQSDAAQRTSYDKRDDAMPVKVNALDHLVINVDDVARTAEWYAKILGMEIRVFDPGRGQDASGPRWYSATRRSMCGRRTPTRSTGSPPIMRPPAATISASSPRARRTRWSRISRRTASRSRKARSEKQGARGTLLSVYCRDPDGSL